LIGTMDVKRPRIIAISSGKGGVGKTFVTLQLAATLAALKRRVVLFDGDLGLANVHVLLGINPSFDISAVVTGEKTLPEIMVDGPLGMRIIPGASGMREMAELDGTGLARVLQDLTAISPVPDVLLIDTGAGIGPHVTTLARLADALLVVVRDEPASLADAYGLIKVMHRDFGFQKIEVIVNDTSDARRAEGVFVRLNEVSMRFLGLPLTLAGVIPHDASVAQATRRREMLAQRPDSPAATALRKIANNIAALPPIVGPQTFLLDRAVARPAEAS